MSSKVCRGCMEDKILDEYRTIIIKRSDGTSYPRRLAQCFHCELKKQRQYKLKNAERLHQRDLAYYARTREIRLQKGKEYLAKNRPARNNYIREYKKKKRLEDPSFRIYENLRKRIWKVMARGCKSSTSINLLGCDLAQYKQWLEFTFTEDLTWDNYGSQWHIDHVIPISSFDLTIPEQQQAAFHWTNTRAASVKENLIKGSAIDNDLIAKIKEDVNLFKVQFNIQT